MPRVSCVLLLLMLGSGFTPVLAGEAAPYFVSIKGDEANMREGPSNNHRIKWIYHRKGLPLEVLATYDVWRRVRDMDGEIGWIHTALLSRERMAVVKGAGDAFVHRREDTASDVVAEAKPGAIGRLMECKEAACEIAFDGARGWIARTRLWGVRDGEQF